MMKETELRIGNYVQEKTNDGEVMVSGYTPIKKVVEIGIDEITIVGYTQHIDMIQPIPLTEEWLVKFGFENNKMNGFEIGYIGDDFVKRIKTVTYLMSYLTKIKYVHQLQNLYFAIRGKELIIK